MLDRVAIRGNSAEGSGGGIYNNGVLVLAASVVDDNDAESSGGGIFNAASRSARITRSTISNNQAMAIAGGIENNGAMTITSSTLASNWSQHGGGGLAVIDGGITTIIDSTINDNIAGESGGGVVAFRDGKITLTNSTVSSNHGGGDDPEDRSWGGGVDNTGGSIALFNTTVTGNVGGTGGLVGTATLANTILAGNTQYFSADPSDCFGPLISQGYNLIGATKDCEISGDSRGNLLNVSPRLGPLRDNGGATLTHVLQPGSPAIDAGSPEAPETSVTACPATDQRGIARSQDGDGDTRSRCDIGAVERRSVSRP
jgi:predicted outer membrane repeat protein